MNTEAEGVGLGQDFMALMNSVANMQTSQIQEQNSFVAEQMPGFFDKEQLQDSVEKSYPEIDDPFADALVSFNTPALAIQNQFEVGKDSFTDLPEINEGACDSPKTLKKTPSLKRVLMKRDDNADRPKLKIVNKQQSDLSIQSAKKTEGSIEQVAGDDDIMAEPWDNQEI